MLRMRVREGGGVIHGERFASAKLPGPRFVRNPPPHARCQGTSDSESRQGERAGVGAGPTGVEEGAA